MRAYRYGMTRLMEQIIERLRAVPEAQQDGIAQFLMHELAEDERCAESTRTNGVKVSTLVEGILADDVASRCEPLDPNRL